MTKVKHEQKLKTVLSENQNPYNFFEKHEDSQNYQMKTNSSAKDHSSWS